MEPGSWLPHSQEPTTCPHPEPDRSNPCPHPTSQRSILILFFHVHLGLPSGLLPSGFRYFANAPKNKTKERLLSLFVFVALMSHEVVWQKGITLWSMRLRQRLRSSWVWRHALRRQCLNFPTNLISPVRHYIYTNHMALRFGPQSCSLNILT